MDKSIDTLRKYFTISVAAFDFSETISDVCNLKIQPSPMKLLHLMAKEEVFKESPDLKKVEAIIAQMESLAEENNSKHLSKFPPGSKATDNSPPAKS